MTCNSSSLHKSLLTLVFLLGCLVSSCKAEEQLLLALIVRITVWYLWYLQPCISQKEPVCTLWVCMGQIYSLLFQCMLVHPCGTEQLSQIWSCCFHLQQWCSPCQLFSLHPLLCCVLCGPLTLFQGATCILRDRLHRTWGTLHTAGLCFVWKTQTFLLKRPCLKLGRCCPCHSGTLNITNEIRPFFSFIKEHVGMSQFSTLGENSPFIEMDLYAYSQKVIVLLGFMCHASVLIVDYSHHFAFHQK